MAGPSAGHPVPETRPAPGSCSSAARGRRSRGHPWTAAGAARPNPDGLVGGSYGATGRRANAIDATMETTCIGPSSPDATAATADAAPYPSRMRSPRPPMPASCWSASITTRRCRSRAPTPTRRGTRDPLNAVRDELAPEAIVKIAADLSPAHALRRVARRARRPDRRRLTPSPATSAHPRRRPRAAGASRRACAVAIAPDPLAPHRELRNIGVGIDSTPESRSVLWPRRATSRSARALACSSSWSSTTELQVGGARADGRSRGRLRQDRRVRVSARSGSARRAVGRVRPPDDRRDESSSDSPPESSSSPARTSTSSCWARDAGVRCDAWPSAAHPST